MQANDFSATCNACQHEIGAGSALKPSKAKALDCKHTLCSDCFTARIRILHQDKIMILKCPIPTCRTVTTKALPASFCTSARKFGTRNRGSASKVRPAPSSVEKKKKDATNVLLEQFNDVAVHSIAPPKTQSAMHSDIEWSIYGVRVMYTVVVLGALAGVVCGCETLFSNPHAHLDSYYSSIVLPVLMLVLFAAEFVPQNVLAAHKESIQSVQIVDVFLVLVLCGCTFGDVNYGATHSLGRFLSMSLTTHFLPLMVLSVVVLKCVSILYSVVLYTCGVVSSVASKLYTQVRNSNICIRLFGSSTLVPTHTNTAFTTPTKNTKHTTSRTVRTMGLQYDSRYVCAPSVLSISSGSMYGDSVCTDSVYSDSLLALEDAPLSTLSGTNTVNTNNTNITTTTQPTTTQPTTTTTTQPTTTTTTTTHTTNLYTTTTTTHTNHTTDLSPSVQSDTSTESAQMRKNAMNMLVDGYAWDNGVGVPVNTVTTTTNATFADNTKSITPGATYTPNSTYFTTDTNTCTDIHASTHANISTSSTYTEHPNTHDSTSPTPSIEVYSMYNQIVHSIENLTTTNLTTPSIVYKNAMCGMYEEVDTTPVVYPTRIITTTNTIKSINTTNTSTTASTANVTTDNTTGKYGTIYDEYDSEFADKYLNDSFEFTQDIVFIPDSICIPPGELDLSMESAGCVDSGDMVNSVVYSSSVDSVVYGASRGNNMEKGVGAGGIDSYATNSLYKTVDSELDSLAYSTSSTSNSIKSSTFNSNPSTPTDHTTHTTDTNTLPYTPYTIPTTTDIHTIDVYSQPTPLFRVPRIPNEYADLNTSPYVTPAKGGSDNNGGTGGVGVGSGDSEVYQHTSCGISAPVFTTPTKSTYNTNNTHNTNDTNNTNTNTHPDNYTNTTLTSLLTPLHTPLHTTSTTTVAESPDDEFKLRSNIKLKPLGMFGPPLHNSNTGNGSGSSGSNGSGSGGGISDRARSIYSSSVFSGDMHKQTTNYTASTNRSSAIPDSYYSVYSNPVSPVKGTNTSVDSISVGGVGTPVSYKHTSSGTSVMNINNDNTNTSSTNTILAKNNTNKPTKTTNNNVNNSAQMRFKGILGPSMNLIR